MKTYRYFCQNCDDEGISDRRFSLCEKCEGVMIVFSEINTEWDEEKDKSGWEWDEEESKWIAPVFPSLEEINRKIKDAKREAPKGVITSKMRILANQYLDLIRKYTKDSTPSCGYRINEEIEEARWEALYELKCKY